MRGSVAVVLLVWVIGGALGLATGLPLSNMAVASRSVVVSTTSHYGDEDPEPRYIFLPADSSFQKTGENDPNGLPEIYMQLRWRSSQT